MKKFLQLSITLITFTLFFSPQTFGQMPGGAAECQNILKNLESRKVTLEKMISGIDSLLRASGKNYVPLQILFQIDLSQSDQVAERYNELKKLSRPDSLLLSNEFKKYTECPLEASAQTLLNHLVDLQAQLNAKKVEFLKIEPEKRIILISQYEASRKKGKDEIDLDQQLSSSQKALLVAQSNLIQSEEESTQSSNLNLNTIIVAGSTVDKYLIDIESDHIAFIGQLRSKKDNLDQLQNELASLSKLKTFPDKESISTHYQAIREIWERSVDGLLELFSDIKFKTPPELPKLLVIEPKGPEEKKSYQDYLRKYKKLKPRRIFLAESKTKILNELRVQNFKLLKESGMLRATFLNKCDAIGCDRPRGIKERNIRNIMREVRVAPLRFMASGLSKWLEIRTKINSGIDGWIDLSWQLFYLTLLILLPFILFKLLHKASEQIVFIRKRLLSRSIWDYRRRTLFAIWLARINPFVPIWGMILGLALARILLQRAELSELSSILFYPQLYYIYRFARLLLEIGFETIFSTDSVNKFKQQKIKIQQSATRISRIVFIEYLILSITEDTVQRALAYRLFSNIIFWFNILYTIIESYRWMSEVCESFSARFPLVWNKIQKLKSTKFFPLFLPFMFLMVILNDAYLFISSQLIKTTIVKRILSDVFRKKLESSEGHHKSLAPPNQDYLASFDYYLPAQGEIYIERENSALQQATVSIKKWIEGSSSDDLIIIVGDRGMGKTTALTFINKNINESVQSNIYTVPPKLLGGDKIFSWLSIIFGSHITKIEDIKSVDKALKNKLVLCVDDIQNLFLGVIGGFDAYKIFLEIIGLKTSNILWCLSVNSRSWFYLKCVFGHEHFYGKVFNLGPWNDYEIQKLILSRHQVTNYERTFDESIKAYGSENTPGQQTEAQFFRLLWGQSRGNPRSALMYWISAVASPTPGHIHIGIPSFVHSSLVSSMSNDALFILAAIAKHDNLTHDEIQLVTNIDNKIIRKCLKEFQDKNLTWLDELERIRISSRAQYMIDYFLIGKNFLYE